MSRERLPDRRRHNVAEIEHGGFRLFYGTAPSCCRSPLQAGIDATTIRAALSPGGPLAAALDAIEGSQRPPHSA
jgi:hypothetical protein